MSQKPLRVGIVGCGAITQQWHLSAFRQSKNVEIAALCDVKEDLARSVAQKFHVQRYYADFAEILKREELNLVDICTPPRTHPTLSIQAMEAGHHVLVEKPMALTCGEADEMIRASERNGVKLCVAHNKLFQPVIRKAVSLIREGIIGDLTGVDLRDGRPRDSHGFMNKEHWYHKLPGGVFSEDLPHPLYLATALLGHLEPVAIYTRKLSSYDWVVADEARIILEGEKGTATITASCNWPKVAATVDIFGTRRNLHVDLHSSVLTRYGAGGGSPLWRALDNLSQGYQQVACTASSAINTVLGRRHSGHCVLIGKLIKAIQEDTPPPVTGEEGREVVRLLEKITSQIDSTAAKKD
jgi:predicted dehydrogenase